MSDRRRRRVNDEGEDESADSGPKPRGERPSECESEEESGDIGDLSESESTADDGTEKEDDETEEGTDTETEGSYTEEATDSETETEEGDDYTDEDEEGLDGERQSGDGQEQPEDDKPDDDEDRKNPAYVPRKGAFYEHDSRDGFEDAEEEKAEVIEPKKTKKLWQEESKWGHDCYREDLQAPKSREELMALYGYDILVANEAPEAPPMMKRGRGRGRKRDAQFNDYLPRMAVIDTTEYGADTVPTLDEDGMISYRDSKPVRSSRGRGTHVGRGGNSNSTKFHGRDNTDGYPGGDREDNKYSSRPQQREATTTPVHGSQDARNTDFPSLGETRGGKSNRDYNKDRGGRDHPQQYGNQSNRDSVEQSNSYNNNNYDRNNRRSAGSGRFGNNSYDDDSNSNSNYNRRGGGDSRNGGNHYQGRGDARNYGNANSGRSFGGESGGGQHQSYGDNSGGGGYGNHGERRDNYVSGVGGPNNDFNRQMESNWRRSDPSGSDNNRRVYQEQRGGGGVRGRGRGDNGGRSRPYDGGDDYRDRGYGHQKKMPQQEDNVPVMKRTIRTGGYDNTPPRHQQQQQQQQQHIDAREYTSSKAGGGGGIDNRTVSTPRPSQGPGGAGGENSSSSNPNNSSSNNVVISNKENVQTINVTITSTTTEKKSYAKERRAKGAATAIPKAGGELLQQGSQAMVMAGQSDGKSDMPGKQFPPPPVSSSLPMVPGGGGGPKRYSSQRQQQQPGYSTATDKTTPGLPVDQGASTLYNPAMPPPSFFQHDTSSTGGNAAPPPGPPPQAGGHQEPQQRFNPSILPPGNPALSFGLPVPTPGIAIPAPTGSPNMFQGPPASIGGPPATAGPPLMGPPFIAPGMMYGTSPTPNPRVPPPATPVGFSIPLAAYPAGPPPPPTQPPSNVGPPPVSQGATNSVPGGQQLSAKPKKVYRGDITYYAPELQQPARTTQKRPKSAIPIVDPQEISQMKAMEKLGEQQREQSEKSALSLHSSSTPLQSPPEGSAANTAGVVHSSDSRQVKEEQTVPSSSANSTKINPKEELVSEQGHRSENSLNSDVAVNSKSDGSVNNSISDSSAASHAQVIPEKGVETCSDSKKEVQIVDARVVSSPLSTDSPLQQDTTSSLVEQSGDAGQFIKGKCSEDIMVVDSSSSSSNVKQELSPSVVSNEDKSSSCVDGQSSSETVTVKEEIAS